MILTKWRLEDPVAGDQLLLARNPRTMTSVAMPQSTAAWASSVGPRMAFRTGRKPMPWEFSGMVPTKADYEALEQWSRRPNKIHVIDHYGRVHEVVPVSFEPKPRRSRQTFWRFDYTFKALYVRRIS